MWVRRRSARWGGRLGRLSRFTLADVIRDVCDLGTVVAEEKRSDALRRSCIAEPQSSGS